MPSLYLGISKNRLCDLFSFDLPTLRLRRSLEPFHVDRLQESVPDFCHALAPDFCGHLILPIGVATMILIHQLLLQEKERDETTLKRDITKRQDRARLMRKQQDVSHPTVNMEVIDVRSVQRGQVNL